MDTIDRKLLKLTQDGIPLVPEPFVAIASSLGITEDEVLKRIQKLVDGGVIRRFAASIGHRAIGITANAMCAWKVPDKRADVAGKIIANFDEVTHCYERSCHPDWEYNVFAMIHGRTRKDCEETVKRISKAIAIYDYKVLFSEREFKKTGVRIE
ncbi:MAG: AsnC family transcriptional regulator [Methanosarcinales archaeon Met12]|nr:MAG: AsnC family transcriptional regulator [Methanosarcinales archaeon Met12]